MGYPPDAASGQIIAGNYQLRREVGDEHPFCWMAVHRRTGAYFLLWFAPPEAALPEPGEREPDDLDWRPEVAVSKLGHRALLGFQDLGPHEGSRALARPYHERDLFFTQVSPERAVDLVGQLLDGLGVLHAAGLAHGAIHPRRLLLDEAAPPREQLRLVSFDGSYRLEGGRWRPPPAPFRGGVAQMAFLPGEILTGKVQHAERVDLYAAGAVLFGLLTGTPPIERDSPSDLMMSVIQGQVRRQPSQLAPATPRWLDDVVARAMERDPADRFASAAEMAAALRSQRARG